MIRRLLHRLVAAPAVYDRVQSLAGADEIRRRIAPLLPDDGGIVLYLGGGTGASRVLAPPGSRYVLLDLDPEKLAGFSRGHRTGDAIVGDVTRLCIRDRGVATALCVAVSHHLDDAQLPRLFEEAARVVSGRFVFLDATRTDRWASRALWHYDRGSNPRRAEVLEAEMARHFRLVHAERFAIIHTYSLLVGEPRRP